MFNWIQPTTGFGKNWGNYFGILEEKKIIPIQTTDWKVMGCKHLVGIKCQFQNSHLKLKEWKTTCQFDRGQWQFPNLFSFKVLFPEVKSSSGMMRLHKLMRSSDLHIVTFSFHHLPQPYSQWWGPKCSPLLPKCFWAVQHPCTGSSSSMMAKTYLVLLGILKLFFSRFGPFSDFAFGFCLLFGFLKSFR